MSISIPEEKITDSLIEHLNDAGRSETTINVKSTMKSRIEIFCNVLIAHGIVSPPKPSMTECLVYSLEEILNYTGGDDSALDDEYVVERAQNAIAKAKGGAE